jgi:TRAP-type mannitol/chloroaromatic compound transport system permease small subunit
VSGVSETTAVAEQEVGPIMSAALAYQRSADRVSEFFGNLAQYFVLLTIVVGLVNTVLRYIGANVGTKLTSNAVIEAQWYLYSMIFLLSFGYVLKHGINVRVDFWFTNQSKRTKAWIDLIGHSISLIPFCGLGLWISWKGVTFSWSILEQSPDASGLPRYPIKTMILVGIIILSIQAVAEVIKNIAVLRGIDIDLEIPDAPIRVE